MSENSPNLFIAAMIIIILAGIVIPLIKWAINHYREKKKNDNNRNSGS